MEIFLECKHETLTKITYVCYITIGWFFDEKQQKEKAMQVQTYCNKTREEVLVEQRQAKEKAEVGSVYRVGICKSLGMDVQAERQSADAASIGITAEMFFPNLSFYEWVIWNNFLPTKYLKSQGRWKEYKYDTIPLKALEEISFAHSLGVFDDIQIWTPERNVDPVAVGQVYLYGNVSNFFLIARWGESLKPFKEIEKEVCSEVGFGWSVKNETLVPKLREWVESYKREFFQKSLNSRLFYFGRSNFFDNTFDIRMRHCGQRMHRFSEHAKNPYITFWVCPTCLYTKTK